MSDHDFDWGYYEDDEPWDYHDDYSGTHDESDEDDAIDPVQQLFDELDAEEEEDYTRPPWWVVFLDELF